jgi:hypothetical protein
MSYNTEVSLWVTYLANNPCHQLKIRDGHILSKDGVIARFTDNSEAVKTLREAGYPNQLIQEL